MKKLLLLFSLSMILTYTVGAMLMTQEDKRATSIEEAMRSVVKIEVYGTGNALNYELKEATGTGFFIREDMVLTVAHVPLQAGVTKIKVTMYSDDYFKAETCIGKSGYRDEVLDLVVLKVDCTGTPLKLAAGYHLGQDGFMLGNRPEFDWIVSDGILSRIIDTKSKKYLIFDLDGGPGNSGSPIVNSNGEVLAITESMHKEYDYLKFGIPSDSIQAFIKRAGI